MFKRFALSMVLAVAVASPTFAHCGKCGEGDEKAAEAKSHGHGHDHAHAVIGKPAPNFKLKGIDGEEYSLADMKGKIVVLEWTNHQCPVVQMCHGKKVVMETRKEFEGKPVVWMAIDSSWFAADKTSDIQAWAKENGADYPILLDPEGTIGHQYGAKATPHMFVIDKEGVLRYNGAIDNNRSGNKEDPRNYVAEAVNSLLKGSAVATAETKPYGCSVKYKKK